MGCRNKQNIWFVPNINWWKNNLNFDFIHPFHDDSKCNLIYQTVDIVRTFKNYTFNPLSHTLRPEYITKKQQTKHFCKSNSWEKKCNFDSVSLLHFLRCYGQQQLLTIMVFAVVQIVASTIYAQWNNDCSQRFYPKSQPFCKYKFNFREQWARPFSYHVKNTKQ